MKIRNGFVSNSSTSSFIILGFKIKQEQLEGYFEKYYHKSDEDDYNDWLYDDHEEFEVISDCNHCSSGEILIGKRVAQDTSSEDGYLEEFSLEFQDLDSLKKELEFIKEEVGITDPIKIYGGTRTC